MTEPSEARRPSKTPLWVRFVAAFFVILILVGLVAAPFALFGKSPLLDAESGQMMLDDKPIKYLPEGAEVRVNSGSVLRVRGGAKLVFEEGAELSAKEQAPYAAVKLVRGSTVASRVANDRQCFLKLGPFTLTLDHACEAYLESNPNQEIGGSVASGSLLLQCDPTYADKSPPEKFDMNLFKAGIRLGTESSFGVVGERLFIRKAEQAAPEN